MSAPRKDHGDRRGISSWSIVRPVGTLTLASVVVVLGLFFVQRLPLDLLPPIVYPQVRVNVNNSGVDPEVLEETIAKPLEAALATTENLVRMETDVTEGRVSLTLEFSYSTDIDFAMQDAAKNLETVRSRLPEEADPPTIFKFDPSQQAIFDAGFSSPTRDLIALRDFLDNRLRPQLLTIEGVASVDVAGGLTREIEVEFNPTRLQAFGLSVAQVTNALRAENQDVAAGRFQGSSQELVGRTTGKFRSVDDLRSLLLVTNGGQRVPLSQVAEVRDGNAEQRMWARLNGQPAVKLSIRKQPEANTVKVADEIEAKLASLRETNFIPADVEMRVLNNQASFVRASVNSVRNAAIGGGLLAMLVVFLFLGSLRKTFVIGLAIPLALLATFVMMGGGGLTLNIISLGGLALGIGLLIDNSIVMLENIFRHTEELHDDPLDAAHVGSSEVTSAVVASTATNLAAVVPFLLITGLTALIFRELILTISFAIIASLAVALTVVPSVAAQLAKVKFKSGVNRFPGIALLDRGVGAARRLYRRVGPSMVTLRYPIVIVGFASLAGASFLVRDLGTEFLPSVDSGNIGSFISLPPGSSPEETNQVVLELEQMIAEMPDVETVFSVAGGFIFGSSTAERAGRGSVEVRLVPLAERTLTADQWVQQMQAKVNERGFPGTRAFFRPPQISGLRTNRQGAPVALTIVGEDLEIQQEISRQLVAALSDIPGLENMEPSNEEGSRELTIELDRERAVELGLDVQSVGSTLRTAVDGTVATQYTEGNQQFDVRVTFPRETYRDPASVGSIPLFPSRAGGAPIYLRDVADVYTRIGPASILRENQNRIMRLTGDVIASEASVGEVADAVATRLATLDFPDGYAVILGGEADSIAEQGRQLTTVILVAIFLVFVVMAVQYESLVNPFAILLSIPLSLVGVAVALWVTGSSLSAPVLLGVILLAGIVVNNAILLVEYIEQFQAEGHTRHEAVVEAGSVRLRPILMTSLTTGVGMLPLALGIGEGSSLMQPLAIAVVGGLGVSTLLTLFVVPSAYLILHGLVDRAKGALLRQESSAAPSEAIAGD
ncbi:efflux RND transporter permease subunit [Gaopeijia maritima]|uniref:efflux RND transporter permease subunit n=1 Tax=Gaopeijia maritima TaxID=3119007 RepID=UPI003287B188